MSNKMDSIIFVPGILGSELYIETNGNKDLIWPPSIFDLTFGYSKIDKLLSTNVRPGEPISKVLIKDVYSSLLNDLNSIALSINANFLTFGYDWRKSIQETAILLGEKIETQKGKIYLVAHSMGGLVCRYLLESDEFANKPWFPQIARFIGLAVPNLGSPLALVRALGLQGSVSLSGNDIFTLSSNENYPSLYQLLPSPEQLILWRVDGVNINPINHYEESIVRELELSERNIEISRNTWKQLNISNKPQSVQYSFLGGTGHRTVTRIDLLRRSKKIIEGRDAGDGTVTLWSSIQGQYQNAVAYGSPGDFFKNNPARELLYNIFSLRAPLRGQSANNKPIVNISTQSNTYSPQDEIDIIVLPLIPCSRIEGVANLEKFILTEKNISETNSVKYEPYGAEVPVIYNGPEIALARLKMRAPIDLGIYRISFKGSHCTSPEQETVFFVTPGLD